MPSPRRGTHARTHRRTTAKHNASRGLNVYSMGMHESTTNLSVWPTGADLRPKTRLTTTTWHYISKCICYIYNNICSVDFFETRPGGITRGHPYKLYERHSCCSTRSSFFSERIVNAWNNLPVDTYGLFELWGLSFYSCVFIVTILYLRAVVRAKTVSLSVRHIAYFTVHFCMLCK